MGKIKSLVEIRRDGKIINESMNIEDIFALGLPEKIITIQWRENSNLVSFNNYFGISSKIVQGGDFIVVNEHQENNENTILSILNSDGTRRFEIPNIQKIREVDELGKFLWYEKARTTSPHIFGIVFSRNSDNSMFQLDFDATSGARVGAYSLQ